jgi:hypothetical protein
MASVWNIFKQVLGSAGNATKEAVTSYLLFLRTLATWSLVAVVGLLALLAAGLALQASWLVGLCMVALTLVVTGLLMAAFPLITLAGCTYGQFKATKRTARIIGAFAFWALLAAMYFSLVPAWNHPAAMLLVLLIFVVLAVAFARFGIGINPRLAVAAVLVVLLLVTMSFIFPASFAAAAGYLGGMDRQLAERMTRSLHPAPTGPQRIEYDLSSIATITFFDPLTSEARVWYYAGQDGGIELFDRPGYHPQYKAQLEAITPAIVAQIRGRLDADAQKNAVEEKRRKEEAQRANPTPPQRIGYDYASIERITFFDPLTAEPRVWYYKAKDGTIDLFDRPGYHPQYGAELKPIVPEIVGEIRKQSRAAPGDVSRRGSPPVRKPPVIAPEDANGRVEGRREQQPLRRRDTTIEPEQTGGEVVRPKNK